MPNPSPEQQAQSAFREAQEEWRRALESHRLAPPDAGFSARLAGLAAAAAAEAGLAAGDVIQEINHQAVRSADDAVRLTEHAESRKTLLRLWSHGATHYLVVDETDSKSSP